MQRGLIKYIYFCCLSTKLYRNTYNNRRIGLCFIYFSLFQLRIVPRVPPIICVPVRVLGPVRTGSRRHTVMSHACRHANAHLTKSSAATDASDPRDASAKKLQQYPKLKTYWTFLDVCKHQAYLFYYHVQWFVFLVCPCHSVKKCVQMYLKSLNGMYGFDGCYQFLFVKCPRYGCKFRHNLWLILISIYIDGGDNPNGDVYFSW